MKEISILKKIKGKPSIALQYMVDGLVSQSKRKDFRIDMSTFGSFIPEKNICFGCAATSTIQGIGQKDFKNSRICTTRDRADFLGFDYDELIAFEAAIDECRRGNIRQLFIFCGKYSAYLTLYKDISPEIPFCLHSDDWKEQLPKVRILIKELKQLGY